MSLINKERFLYKYKPLYFNDFVINCNIIHILKILISINKLNILFVGGSCSGKTTWINAVIREYYKDIKENDYIDNIINITNMKEQGINYFRNTIKETCKIRSSIKHKNKIIFMDDIDTLGEQHQQIFRGYIDNYSKNVCFVGSCSNTNKINEGLKTRFIIINLNQFTTNEIYKLCTRIIKQEQILIDTESKDEIVNICLNNPKTLMNYLEKIKLLGKPVTIDIIHDICMNINYKYYHEYTNYIIDGNLKDSVLLFYNIYNKGYSVIDILCEYFNFIKITKLFDNNNKYLKNNFNKYELITYISKYIALFNILHEDEIELCFFTNNIIAYMKKNNYIN
jgi:DNA polymerase III delta prime subunit